MTTYPLLHILFYLSLLFAPPEAKKITITGPDLPVPVVLTRDAQGWQMLPTDAPEGGGKDFSFGGGRITISPGRIVQSQDAKEPMFQQSGNHRFEADVRPFVPAADVAQHDWKTSALLALNSTTCLGRTAEGYAFFINRGDPTEKFYRIVYDPPTLVPLSMAGAGEPLASIKVNVLGEVKNPGAYPLPAGSTLVDAIAAAGGWTRSANISDVSVLSGPAGKIPKRQRISVKAILDGKGTAPSLEDRDTVYMGVSTY